MLIISIFLIFSSIFGFIYYEHRLPIFENNLKDLIKSISMYSRVFGYLPENNNQKNNVPWEKIGISHTFFSQYIKYKPNNKFLDKTLFPFDYKLIMRNTMEIATQQFIYATNINNLKESFFANMKKNNLYNVQSNDVFCLYLKNWQIDITKEIIADSANYPIQIAQIDKNSSDITIYNVLSVQFILNIRPYY